MLGPAKQVPMMVTARWLLSKLQTPRLKPLDATWLMPDTTPTAYSQFLESRIPGARFFDIDVVCDPVSPLPHMLPTMHDFSKHMTQLGIQNDDYVVIYDKSPVKSSHRVYWTLRLFGHEQVSMLDGGWNAWLAEHGPIESGELNNHAKENAVPYVATRDPASDIVIYEDILSHLGEEKTLSKHGISFVDARAKGRFTGELPEPRPGVPSGHMPGSRSVPFTDVLDGDGRLKPKQELQKIFKEAGIDLQGQVVASCASGVTACVVVTALNEAGAENVKLYDGSWTEYATRPESTIVKGEV